MLKKLFTGSILFFVLIIRVSAQQPTQSKAELEKERASIQKEIDEVKRSLDDTRKNKRQNLQQLTLLQRRLRLRESAIRNMNQQIDMIQGDMNESWREIIKLRAELDTLRAQYAQSLVFAYKNRTNYDFLNFIFSATSVNDALRRIQYLKSYRSYREERAADILRTQNLLQSKIDGLKVTRVEKEDALKKQSKEKDLLEDEKKEKDQVVNQLKSQEKDLTKQMAAKQLQDKKLNIAIQAAIRRALEEAHKEREREDAARRIREKAASDKALADRQAQEKAAAAADKVAAAAAKAANKPAPPPTVIPSDEPVAKLETKSANKPTGFDKAEDITLTGDFMKNKGHLPWPATGTIAEEYGLHEYIKGITHFNMGLTIEAPNAAVKAIFDGEVQSIQYIGDEQMIMIRHGSYFSTYSNLGTVSVTKGQQVHTGQIIGRVAEGSQLEFVLSDEKGKTYDPEKWLRH